MKGLEHQPSRKDDEKSIDPDTKARASFAERAKKLGRVAAVAGPAMLSAIAPAKAEVQDPLRNAITESGEITKGFGQALDKFQEAMSIKLPNFDSKMPDLSVWRVPKLDESGLPEKTLGRVVEFSNSLQALETIKSMHIKSPKELLEMPQTEAGQYAEQTGKQLRAYFETIERTAKALEEALQYGVRGYRDQYRAVFELRLKTGGYSIYLGAYDNRNVDRLFSGMKAYQESSEKYATQGTKKYDVVQAIQINVGLLGGPHRWFEQLSRDLPPLLDQLEKSFAKLKDSGAR